MNIGIASPYFDSFGGGERYMLTLASHWSSMHDVAVFWDDARMLRTASERFALPLDRVRTVPNVFHGSLFQKLSTTASYDLIVMLTDGSVPLSLAKHNILHFQMPFAKVHFPFWKKNHIDAVVCNSFFTKENIDPSVGKKAKIIYPPVAVELFSGKKKTHTILSVGRFAVLNSKKQDVLIKAFKMGVEKKLWKDMTLILAGGCMKSDEVYYQQLVKSASGLPIQFFPNASFETLQTLYGEASLYWHAAGYEETDPTRFEHFGISTVESMASECIPLVYDGGGQKEIVSDGVNGFLWTTIDELLVKTSNLLQSETMQKKMRIEAKKQSQAFSVEAFTKKFDELILHL